MKLANFEILKQYLSNSSFYSAVNVGEKSLQSQSEKNALFIFQQSAKRVPAYKDILKKNNVDPDKIHSISDFQHLPVLTKDNYIYQYSNMERSWDGNFDHMHMISSSSGTTGKPIFWPRGIKHEIDGAFAHEYIFDSVLGVDEENILFINGFALGNWIAGMFTHNCLNLLTWKGYCVTAASPGYSLDAVVEVLTKIAPQFSRTVLVGHTPFLKEIVDISLKMKIDLKTLSLQFLGTGQAITETWRSYIEKQLGSTSSFFNLYGSADASLMGFETTETIFWRRQFANHPELLDSFFGRDRLPSIYAYDPRLTYFEELEHELVITKDGGCPLIRYNIHDEGGIFSQSKFRSKVNKSKQVEGDSFADLPLVYLFGRDKFMVKLYGANIYTEHIQQVLEHKDIHSRITGRFQIQIDQNEQLDSTLVCRIELNRSTKSSIEFVQKVEGIFVDHLRAINSEYDFVFRSMGNKVNPRIIFHKHGDEKYFPLGKVKKSL